MTIQFTSTVKQSLKILDFDVETRPLGWYAGDWTHKEITAIAAKFLDEKKVYCWLLGVDDPKAMLEGFLKLYNKADMVTGHYIRGFDLPTINGALFDLGLPPLGSKLTHDTKNDLIKIDGLSKSMENLGAMLDLKHEKVIMNVEMWRRANRLTPEGLKLTKKRVVGDIIEHIEFREALIDGGYLGPPVLWNSHGKMSMRGYTP